MISTVVRLAISGAVVAIAGSCGRNMLQTAQVTNQGNASTLNQVGLGCIRGNSSDVAKHLELLNRKELLQLFTLCDVPTDLSVIEGEWDGKLLENNGLLMTKVSAFMTHGLFALGSSRQWAGKRFGVENGSNRFFNQKTDSYDTDICFDASIQESSLQTGNPCVRLSYYNHQSPFSLWKTMVDELRIIPGCDDVLLGMGSMAWSGGSKNAAPFYLHRITEKFEGDENVSDAAEL
eukprot:scaffold880_cov132-Cylindrotheca_fusiformis.AAC.29